MVATNHYDLDIDTTLGGNSASDYIIPSQKAIKNYVDNHSGGGSVDIDNITITENSSDELQTVGVIDQNNTSNAIKTWTGTKAQYDAIVTKDSNTLYNITDDSDVTFALLELIYPVGSIYIGTMSVCPLQTLGLGTWQLVAEDRVLQGVGQDTTVGDLVEAGLPNITGQYNSDRWANYTGGQQGYDGALGTSAGYANGGGANVNGIQAPVLHFDASKSNSIYGNSSTVQPPAYIVNIWERIS